MDVQTLAIPGLLLLQPKLFADARGSFAETYSARTLSRAGINAVFVQDNESVSVKAGTVRGLHFQTPPRAQGKLVRVVAGAIFDVAVDIRAGSPTYGTHVAVEISAVERRQLWVPTGFAHGFCTLEPNTIVIYKTTDDYARDHDFGLQWNDPALGICWPVTAADAILSDKDCKQPALRDLAPISPIRPDGGAASEQDRCEF